MLLVSLCGCEAISSAREAQNRARAIGDGEEVVERVPRDLLTAPLPACVAYALSARPSVRSAQLAVDEARLALKAIAADAPLASETPWNAANASMTLGYSEASRQDHLKDLGGTRKGKAKGTLSLDLLIWDFGRNAARARAQAESVLAAELALMREGDQVFGDVSSAYFACRRDEALRSVAETKVVAMAERLRRAEDRLNVGEAMALDVTRARLDLATARESLVAASNAVVTARAGLLFALGGASEAASTPADDVPADLTVLVPVLPETVRTAAEAYETGRTNAPSVAVARARLRAASAQVDYAVADLKPELSASVGLSWTDPLWYWNWGATAVQSLFTGFRKTTAVDRAVVALETATSDVAAAEQTLAHEIERAVADRDTARETLVAAEARVREAKENLETVMAREAVGEASRVDVSDAVSAQAEALGSRIRAFYAGQTAEATLARVLGEAPAFLEGSERKTTEEVAK